MKRTKLFTAVVVSLVMVGTLGMRPLSAEAADCKVDYEQISCFGKGDLPDSYTIDLQSVLDNLIEQQVCENIMKFPVTEICGVIAEIKITGQKTPEVKVMEVKIPEMKAPEVKEPETKAPEVKEPETKAPEVKEPETKAPEVKEPETKAPEVKEPEIKAPEVKEPETKAPEVKEPETKAPEVKTPQSNYAQQVVELVNEERAKYGLQPLSVNKDVQAAAQVRAMEIQTSFSHTRPNGKSFTTALQEQNVAYRGAGENIAWGQRTPQQVMDAWMNSDGHRANILNSKFTAIAVGYYQNEKGVNYWTQLFIY